MRCKGCCYPLEGMTNQRCPECGRHFDPYFESTYQSKPVNGRILLFKVAFIVAFMILQFTVARLTGLTSLFVGLGMLGGGFVVVFLQYDVIGEIIGVVFRNRKRWVVHPIEFRISAAIAIPLALGELLFLLVCCVRIFIAAFF
jgi:hypothetical protein